MRAGPRPESISWEASCSRLRAVGSSASTHELSHRIADDGSGKGLVGWFGGMNNRPYGRVGKQAMEWTIKLEARTGWGEVETIEVARVKLGAQRIGRCQFRPAPDVGQRTQRIGVTLAPSLAQS